MLIGAHVSPAGGPAKAIERGVERNCQSIQIFNQNPRAWKPTVYKDEAIAEYREAFEGSQIDALVIHAVYLLNAASDDAAIREKTLASLVASLNAGAALGARGVVLHPGSAKQGDVGEAIARAGVLIGEALKRSDNCELHLENTAGAGGTLGRSFEELQRIVEASGGHPRIGLCLDSCHLYASGYDIRTIEGLTSALEECDRELGLDRLRSLHLNDSQVGLGSNRDRHAVIGEGELGESGCAVFLSEPRFQGMPVILETPGPDGKGSDATEVDRCHRLRAQGIKARG